MELLTIPEAADMLELSRQRVHKLVTQGRIKAQWAGRMALISLKELERFQKTRRVNGRPKRG